MNISHGSKPVAGVDKAIETFAEDLGSILGTTRAKAENWLGQRQNVAKQLEQIRDTASELLNQLTGTGLRLAAAVGRGIGRGGRRGPGTPRKAQGSRATASGAYPRKKVQRCNHRQDARFSKGPLGQDQEGSERLTPGLLQVSDEPGRAFRASSASSNSTSSITDSCRSPLTALAILNTSDGLVLPFGTGRQA